jgi:hypothetical protein
MDILPDLAFNYFSGQRLHFGLQVCVVLEDDLSMRSMMGLEMPLKINKIGFSQESNTFMDSFF